MTTLPSFQIEGVKGLWLEDGSDTIDNLTAEDYDGFIKHQPEAKLKYLDEDDDEVIVGSSAELLDRINELGPGVPIVLQTVTEQGRDQWVAFMLERTTQTADASQQEERPRTAEEVEQSLLEGFQRDLERALKESLTLQNHAEASSSSQTPQDNQPESHPSVEAFLRTIAETVQNTLSQVYPQAQNVTAKLRENPALRQAAEVLQRVGSTANQAINHSDKKKIAEDVKDEVKMAMKNVGTALGEAFAEIGEAYVHVYNEINKEVAEIIQRTRGVSGTLTPVATDTAPTEPKTESTESQPAESSSPKRNLKPTVEEEVEKPNAEDKDLKMEKLMEETAEKGKKTAYREDTDGDIQMQDSSTAPANDFQFQTQSQFQSQSQSYPGETELERALRRAEAHRLERLSTSPPMPGTFSLSEPLAAHQPHLARGTYSFQSQSRQFGSNRFGSFAGGGSSSFSRQGRGGQIFMGPNGFQRQPVQEPTVAIGQEVSEEEVKREHERFAKELEQGLNNLVTKEMEQDKVNEEKVYECMAKLIEMGYDEAFDPERVRSVAIAAEGEVETAIAMLTECYE